MDSSDLAFFVAVVDEGGISRAAQRLNCVQSNVTARVRSLEDELQVPLFRRHGRGVTVTRSGELLLPYARQVTALIAQAKAAVKHSPIPRGRLAIGSMESTAAVRLPPILAAYHAGYPEVELMLTPGPTAALVADVLQHRLDGALVAGPIDHADLLAEPVFSEELVVVAAPSLRWPAPLRSAKRALNVLAFRVGCSYRERIEQWLRQIGVRHVRMLDFGTLDGILGGVAAGIGIALLPRAAVAASRSADHVEVCRAGEEPMIVPTVLIRRRDAFTTSALSAFMDCARGSASGDGTTGHGRHLHPPSVPMAELPAPT